jgi:hypothetical protein
MPQIDMVRGKPKHEEGCLQSAQPVAQSGTRYPPHFKFNLEFVQHSGAALGLRCRH